MEDELLRVCVFFEWNFDRVCVGDAIQMIQDFAHRGEADTNFIAVIVDLNSSLEIQDVFWQNWN